MGLAMDPVDARRLSDLNAGMHFDTVVAVGDAGKHSKLGAAL